MSPASVRVSQGLTTAYRLQRRADAIYARLGADDPELVQKPKRMRWKTFNRQMDLAAELGAQADCHFLLRPRRFGFAAFDGVLANLTE